MTHANQLSPSDRERMLKQLKRHEGTKRDTSGLAHIAYRCTSGALTIGYGHNLDANPIPGITAQSRLSEAEACRILDVDVFLVERGLAERLPFAAGLDPARYAVLVNMAFNMGLGGLLTFSNTLTEVRERRYAHAARRMMQSRWAQQVGYRARDLSRQMESGQWV